MKLLSSTCHFCKLIQTLFLMVCFLSACPARATEAPLLIPPAQGLESQIYPLADHMDYWIEHESVSADAVLAGHYDSAFHPFNQRSIGPHGKNLWFRFTLQSSDPHPAEWILNLENALLLDVELLYREVDGHTIRQLSGMKYPANQQFVPHHYFALPIQQTTETQTYYLRVNTPFYVHFSPTLNNTQGFLKAYATDTALTFLFTGLLTGIFLYLVILFLATKFDAYVIEFAGFTLLALFMVLYMNGFLMPFFAKNIWLKVHMWIFVHTALEVLYLTVTRHYFHTNKSYPRIDQYLGACIATALLFPVFLPIIPFGTLVISQLVFIGHLAIALTLISIYIRIVEGPRVTLFVIGNIGLLIAAAAATIEATMSFRAGEWITKHGPAIGFCWQALFFTWALSRQIRGLRVEKEKLAAENQAKSDFIAKMSHEIRTPLNGVLGMAQVLQSTPLTSEQKHYLNVIESSGKTLLTVINDILDYSKLTAGKVALAPHPFDLEKLLTELNTLFGELAHTQKVHFNTVIVPGTPAYLYGDSVRLHQVLNNLLSNAFKFTEKGTITLHAKTIKASSDSSSTKNNKVMLEFSIQDTGIGISAIDQKNIFKDFSQVDTSLSRSHGGVGLGLSISKQLIEMMGGSISLKSASGKGSEFIFTVPFRKQSLETQRTPSNDSEQTFIKQSKKILVAEDNEINRHVIAGYLEKMGVDADFVENGRQAIEKMANTPAGSYQLVLMDSEMPVMDGLTACRKIRAQEKIGNKKPIAIVALTAHASKTHRDTCLEAGMNDCISKPIIYDQLHATVNKWSGDKQ